MSKLAVASTVHILTCVFLSFIRLIPFIYLFVYCRISIMSHQFFSLPLSIILHSVLTWCKQRKLPLVFVAKFMMFFYHVHNRTGGGRWLVRSAGRLHWICVLESPMSSVLSRCFHANALQFYLLTHLQIIISPFLARSCVIHKFLHPTSSLSPQSLPFARLSI